MTKINQSQGQQRRQVQGSHQLLRAGMRGADVEHLQSLLLKAGIGSRVTGTFDNRTVLAVREYQRTRGLKVDGVVGRETWGSLGKKSQPLSVEDSPAVDEFVASGRNREVAAFVNGRPRPLSVDPIGNGQFLRPDAARSFVELQSAARQNGVNFSARSGFRTMAHQEEIYRADASAARPGYSNHQKGIAVDIRGIGGRGTTADRWLRTNAASFGFRNLPSEFWHYDFVA